MMANSQKRNRSRRRIAAVTFLSNISLDGSYRDTKLSLLPRNGAVIKNDFLIISKPDEILDEECDGPEDCFSDYENVFTKNNNKKQFYKSRLYSTDGQSLSSDSESAITPVKMYLDEMLAIKKERAPLVVSELKFQEKKVIPDYQKRTMQQISHFSDTERQQLNSSSESIDPAPIQNKINPIPPTAIAESTGENEIKFVKCIQNYKFKGERIVMVTNKHTPFLICSFIPFVRNQRTRSETQREVTRKRHISGSRPLSTTGDVFDPFEMLGIEKEQGQEVSYGKFLIPTRSVKEFHDKRPNVGDESLDLSMQSYIRPHHVVARTKVLTRQPGYKW